VSEWFKGKRVEETDFSDGSFDADGRKFVPSGSGGASAAEDVTVADAGGYFTGTNVEDVLQEVGADVGSLPDVAEETHAATGKTTPVDADEIPLADSAASFALKKLTWANLKATAKTYFDTLYQPTDSDLTTIGGLTPSNDDLIQRKAGAWTNRTMAQLISDLSALGTTFQPLDADLTAIAAVASQTAFGRALLATVDASGLRTAAGLPEIPWTVVRKTSDEDVSSNTTLQDDNELFFTASSGVTYEIELVLIYASPLSGATPDIKMLMSEDATLRGALTATYLNATDGGGLTTIRTGSATAAITAGTAAAKRGIHVIGSHVGAGGTFKVQWAQNTSDSNPTTVYTASVLLYRAIV